MKNKLIFFVFIILSACFSFTGKALAAEKDWKATATSSLASVAGNWQGDVLPSSGDDLAIPAGANVVWDLTGVVAGNVASQGALTLKAPLTMTGDLKIGGGTFDSGSNAISVGGSVNLTGGKCIFGASSVNVNGDWNFAGGTADLTSATVSFTGSGDRSILSAGNIFGNLSVNAPGATVKLADDLIGNGTVSISGGTLSLAGKTMTVGGSLDLAGGSVAQNGGKLVFDGSGGKLFAITGGSFNAGAGALVVYDAASGGASVAPADYADLELAGGAIYSLTGPTTVAGNLLIDAGATLMPGLNSVSVSGGKIVNNGKILGATGITTPVGALEFTDADLQPLTALATGAGTIRVSVADASKNRNGGAAETTAGITLTTVSGDKETFTAAETGVTTGVFATASIVLHQGATVQGNGLLEVTQNDIIFATYADPLDPARVKTVQIGVAAATTGGVGAPQIVAGPSLGNWNSTGSAAGTTYSVHVLWTTDLLSSSAVTVTGGNLLQPIAAGSLAPTLNHDVLVTGLARGNVYSYKVSSVTNDGKSTTGKAADFTVITSGDRIKTASSPAVYWFLNGKRNVFPNFAAYDSWFPDFNGVVTVPAGQMADLALGKNVPLRAGTYLAKITSDPRVYAVLPDGKLSWVQNEAQAAALYGANWSKRVVDMDVAFFGSYSYADPLAPGKLPDGFLYASGQDLGIYAGNSLHTLPPAALAANGIDRRFVSQVAPGVTSGFANGAVYFGYAPDANAVFIDNGAPVVAPSR